MLVSTGGALSTSTGSVYHLSKGDTLRLSKGDTLSLSKGSTNLTDSVRGCSQRKQRLWFGREWRPSLPSLQRVTLSSRAVSSIGSPQLDQIVGPSSIAPSACTGMTLSLLSCQCPDTGIQDCVFDIIFTLGFQWVRRLALRFTWHCNDQDGLLSLLLGHPLTLQAS
jgi:hypothetical protein